MYRIIFNILIGSFFFCMFYAVDNIFLHSTIEKSIVRLFKQKGLQPCDCAQAFVSQDQTKFRKCEEHYASLSETEKEIWTQTIMNCSPKSDNTQNTDNLPTHIEDKIKEYTKLNEEYDAIPEGSDLFGEEVTFNNNRKFELLEKMLTILKYIEVEGYSNTIDNFSNAFTSTKLRYEGVKLQIEAANEMQLRNSN